MRDLLEKALRVQEREYGAEHRLVATTLTNLGIADENLGNAQKKRREPFKEARKYCRHSCEDDEVAAVVCDTSRGQLVSLSIGQLVSYHCEDDEVAAVACDTLVPDGVQYLIFHL